VFGQKRAPTSNGARFYLPLQIGAHRLSIRPCSLCQHRVPGKLSTAYWAWFVGDNERIAWKQRLCLPCLGTTFAEILRNAKSASMESITCPACGGQSEADMDPVFCVLYLPKRDPEEFELNLDAACAASLRSNIFEHGERLENRERELRGPSTDSPDPWAELEL